MVFASIWLHETFPALLSGVGLLTHLHEAGVDSNKVGHRGTVEEREGVRAGSRVMGKRLYWVFLVPFSL